MGVGKPDFREGQVENRAKTGKMPDFPRRSEATCPQNIRTPPFHPSDSKYLKSKNRAKNLKSYIFNKFPSIPSTLHLSLPEVLG